MRPLVTIGIPTYRRPETLKRAIKSILSQDYSPIEVVISNDDPNDLETRKVVSIFQQESDLIVYFEQPMNLGETQNSYFVARVASGQYFMWLGDDDEMSPGYVSAMMQELLNDSDISVAISRSLLRFLSHEEFALPESNTHEKKITRILASLRCQNDQSLTGVMRIDLARKIRFASYRGRLEKDSIHRGYCVVTDFAAEGKIQSPLDLKEYVTKTQDVPKQYLQFESGQRLVPLFSYIGQRRFTIRIQQGIRGAERIGQRWLVIFVPVAIYSATIDLIKLVFWNSGSVSRMGKLGTRRLLGRLGFRL